MIAIVLSWKVSGMGCKRACMIANLSIMIRHINSASVGASHGLLDIAELLLLQWYAADNFMAALILCCSLPLS
jgi:hypothetical protein